MKRILKFWARAAVVFSVVTVCSLAVWKVIVLKGYVGTGNQTSSYANFYLLPKNSVDVIFLGTSQSREAFIPQELYNRFGITSYNLSSSSQPALISYYWLKELLRTQHPKVVVLNPLNMYSDSIKGAETNVRMALDYMRFSPVKAEAINTAHSYDGQGQSRASYYLPNIRYHDRWKSLKSSDFLKDEISLAHNFLGYSASYLGKNTLNYQPLKAEDVIEPNEAARMGGFIYKMVQLCNENSIKLIVVQTPSGNHTKEKHAQLEKFAQETNTLLYDLNLEPLYTDTKIDFNEDYVDQLHVNMSGAKKLTDFIGRLLSTEYGLSSHKSEYWESTREAYENFKADYDLKNEKDLNKYLALLEKNKSRYTILLSVKDEASRSLGANAQDTLKSLGLKNNWKDAFRKSYIAVIENGKVLYENMSNKKLSFKCVFDKKRFICQIESNGKKSGNRSSIKIDGAERSKNRRGLNIVVFNNDRHLVIDSVCFDTNAKDNKCYR